MALLRALSGVLLRFAALLRLEDGRAASLDLKALRQLHGIRRAASTAELHVVGVIKEDGDRSEIFRAAFALRSLQVRDDAAAEGLGAEVGGFDGVFVY